MTNADRDEALLEAVRDADAADEPLLLLAGGSNLVVADAGFQGTAVRIATRGIEGHEMADGRVRLNAAAGENWDDLVAACVTDGLAGVEALSGIPGSVGATPIQNVGAYGQEIADVLIGVRAMDRSTGELHVLDTEACLFDYRSSVFKRDPGRWLVLGVSLALEPTGISEPIRYAELARRLGVEVGDRAPVEEVRAAVLALRRGKGMVLDPARPGHGQRRLVLHEPDHARTRVRRVRGAGGGAVGRGRLASGMARRAAHREDLGRLAHRAGRLRARVWQPGRHRDLLQAHARADQPRGRDDRRARRAGAGDRGRRA